MDLSVERLKLSDADGGGEDRLSDLPDDVLIRILVLLEDAAEAARTSILASRWRRLWALLPELTFNFIEHRRIGAALAAHELPDLSDLFALTEDSSSESLSSWLSIAAARAFSGSIALEVLRPQADAVETGAAIDLPCFEKATAIMLKLGFLSLALPPPGVFARLQVLDLVDIQLHGQSSGLGDLLSSQRCPSLQSLLVGNVRGLESFDIQSDSLQSMELSDLDRLQQLNVMTPALNRLKVNDCFTDPLNPDLSVANISAPQLTWFDWQIAYDPSSIQLDKVTHLEKLGVDLFIQEVEETVEQNHFGMTLLRRFEDIHSLDLMIIYLQDICAVPYWKDHMPRLPYVTSLVLGVVAYGHSFGACLFDVLSRCTAVKELELNFVELEEQTSCLSGCICDQPANWRTKELALNSLEEIEIDGMRGAEPEVALVQRLFCWATVLKRVKIIFHESTTESKVKELHQLLLSFSRPDICMDFSIVVP